MDIEEIEIGDIVYFDIPMDENKSVQKRGIVTEVKDGWIHTKNHCAMLQIGKVKYLEKGMIEGHFKSLYMVCDDKLKGLCWQCYKRNNCFLK